MALLKLEHLCKSYLMGDHTLEVLKNINLQIDNGELIGITGKSGSGKTTLMNILGCLDVPTTGHYFIEDKDVARLNPNQLAHIRNKKVGFVFQQFNLLPDLTAIENVALPQLYAGVKPAEAKKRALELLEKVDLVHRVDHYPYQLSGGQQQRISIARALANHPAIILADEPTGNLDSNTGKAIMQMFLDLNNKQGITVILVTHDESIALQAKRIVKLVDGSIIEDRKL